MKMTNKDLIAAINGIAKFSKTQEESGTSFLTTKGQYAVFCNSKTLIDKYKPYEEAYEQAKKQNEGNEEKLKKAIEDLLSISVDVSELRTISTDDFKEGITASLMMCIDFMIADS